MKKVTVKDELKFLKRMNEINERLKEKQRLICEQETPQFSTIEEAVEFYRKRDGAIPIEEYINNIREKYGDI